MSATVSDICDCDSDRRDNQASGKQLVRETLRPRKFIVRIAIVCAILAVGAALCLLSGRSDDRLAPFPLITGEPGPLPYDETGEPRVFIGSPDGYEALRQVYWDCIGDVTYRIRVKPATAKADEDRLSLYQDLVYSRKKQSEDALKQAESRIRNLEEQLHRNWLHPLRLWHTGLMSDERIVQEAARVLKDRRAHEIVIRLGDDLARAININYVGNQSLSPAPGQ